MARMRVRETETAPPISMVAAAGSLRSAIPNKRDRQRRSTRARAWQAEAWKYYDQIGELRYATNWFSSALARADLYIARKNSENKPERVASGPGVDALAELTRQGATRLLKKMAQHHFVTGEMYLIGRQVAGRDSWDIFSASEVRYLNDKWVLDLGDGVRKEELSPSDAVIRLWNPHPNKHAEPDSPVRAVLDDLEEIRLLTSHIRAQILSRLAGAGILVLPQEMTFARPPVVEGQTHTVSSTDEFMKTLAQVMGTAISDPGDPSATVPIIIQAPGEVIEKITHLKFWSELDKEAAEMRTKAVARFALGVDMPPEVLTGTSEANHWGAWAIEESTIKAHIEPALDLMCEQLTNEFLWEVTGDETLFIAYDTTDLKLRPNRSKEALEVYDRGELGATALRRETGFVEDDAPTDAELERFILMTMAKGSATPEMVATAAKILGIEGVEAEGSNMREERPRPSLAEHPTQDVPERVAGACEAVVLRAMERAGNKIKNRMPKSNQVASLDIYRHVKVSHDQISDLLEDAWTTLDRLVPAEQLAQVERGLQSYAVHLLRTQEPVRREEMLKWLTKTL